MSISAIEPVMWVDSKPVQGVVDTPSEIITQWMNSKGITDLTKLAPAQIDTLIAHMKSFKPEGGVPGLNSLLRTLESTVANSNPEGTTELEKFCAELKLRLAVLSELGRAVGNEPNTLTKAAEEINQLIPSLDELIKLIEASPVQWSDKPDALKEQLQNLIENCSNMHAALAQSGAPIEKLGLATLKDSLQNALAHFEKTMQGIKKPDEMQTKLALSNLREAFYQAKADFFANTGVAPANAELVTAQSGVRSEQLRQTSILTPSEDTTASPRSVSIEEIDAAMADLDLQYQLAVSEGDRDAMAHISSKMGILSRSQDMLLAGRDPFLVGLVLFQGLRILDTVSKKVLQARLRETISDLQKTDATANSEQIKQLTAEVDALEVEIDALTKQISQIQDQYESALNTLTQNTNEALSKAF